jgi:hypothetical protein
MTQINWNVAKIRMAIKNLAEQIHNLKKEIRRPNVQISYAQYCALTTLKHNATLLCTITAYRRSKLHLKNKTMEEQQAWLDENLIESVIQSYQK